MPHCEIRAVIFDTVRKLYLSSFYIIPTCAIRKRRQANKPLEPQLSANWSYNENLKSLYVCAPEQGDYKNAALVFEFIIYSENNTAQIEERKIDKAN